METKSSSRRPLGYAVGSVAILVASIGFAAVLFSLYPSYYTFYYLLALILGPWGLLTIVYAFVTGRDFTYYLAWGTIIFAVAPISGLYAVINPLVIIGILLITLVIIGVATYWRGRR
jgi:hypothetical protein